MSILDCKGQSCQIANEKILLSANLEFSTDNIFINGLNLIARFVELWRTTLYIARISNPRCETGEPHKPAGTSLAQIAFPDHDGGGRALGLRGYRFTPEAVFSAWVSRCASASSFLSSLFSASNSRRSLGSMLKSSFIAFLREHRSSPDSC